MKVAACMMVRNMDWCVGSVVSSLDWVDAIYLLDDHSTDRTVDEAKRGARVRLHIEHSPFDRIAFVEGECEVRNYMLKRAFAVTGADMVVAVDGDELFSPALRPYIEEAFASGADAVCTSTYHLFDTTAYLHFWETTINGMTLIDPHTRVLSADKRYKPLFSSGAHPIVPTTSSTLSVDAPLHFHLKYFHLSLQPNYSLTFLPKWLDRDTVRPLLRNLPSPLPASLLEAINSITWPSSRQDTDYYQHFCINRVQLQRIEEALTHPRDADRSVYRQ